MNFQKDVEIVRTFIDETREHLSEMEEGVLVLEKSGGYADDELIHSLFRAAHSIKAGANLLTLKEIAVIAHALENLLQELRQRKLTLTKERVDGFLKEIDQIEEMVRNIKIPVNKT